MWVTTVDGKAVGVGEAEQHGSPTVENRVWTRVR